MPAKLERILKKSAARQGLEPGSPRYNAYVYGTLAKIKRGKKNG